MLYNGLIIIIIFLIENVQSTLLDAMKKNYTMHKHTESQAIQALSRD